MTRYAPTRSLVNSTPDFPNGLTVSLGNVGIGTSSPAGLLHVADASAGGIVVGNNNSAQKGIYFRTAYPTSSAAQDYAITARPNTFQFFKPASTAADSVRIDYENVGSIDSLNPLWSGVHFGTEALKDTNGSTVTYPRVAMYHNYNTVTAAPTNLTFNITPNNAGSVKYSIKIDTANNGNILLVPNGTGVAILGSGEGTATIAGNTLRGPSAVGTNIAGGSLTLAGGTSTGTGAGGSIIFQTAPVGSTGTAVNALAERMRIIASGNVGIRTTSPNFGLHIQGVDASALMIERTANDTTTTNTYTRGLYIRSGPSTSDWGVAGTTYSDANFTNKAWWMSTGKIAFGAGGRVPSDLIIDTNGYVGIGTASPAANLEIYHTGGLTYGTAIQLKTTGGTDGPRLAFEIYHATTPKRWNVGIRNSSTAFGIFEDGYTGAFGTERVTVLAGGNVGIGTTDPKSTFHVSGSQSVKVSPLLASGTTLDATQYIITSAATGNVVYTLPNAATAANRVYIIKRITPGTVNIIPAAGQFIELGSAGAAFSIPAQYDSYTFVSDGTNTWFII